MTCQHTMTLGVYLLGALDPAERYAFESHLSYCDICRGELVRLAPLPGLLNQITPEDFADSMPPTGMEGMTVATRAQPVTAPVPLPFQLSEPDIAHAPEPKKTRPRDKRRNKPPTRPGDRPTGGRRDGRPPRRYWRIAATAAAVVILAVAGIFGWQATREEPAAPVAQGVTWSAADGTASVDARLVDHEWGTEIQSTIHGLPPGRKCYLFVYDHYGNRQVAGWWGTDHDPNEEIPASTSIMRSKIDRLVYMLDDKETVVFTIEAPR
jgi:anti-sigma factor RsiW